MNFILAGFPVLVLRVMVVGVTVGAPMVTRFPNALLPTLAGLQAPVCGDKTWICFPYVCRGDPALAAGVAAIERNGVAVAMGR